MNLDVAAQEGFVMLPRFGARCVLAIFKMPARMPPADVLYFNHAVGIPDPAYVPYWTTEEHTLVCDLAQSEDQLFAQMRKDRRYDIRSAEKNDGLVFKAYSPQDLSASNDILLLFADFYDEFARCKGLSPLRRDDLLAQAHAGLLWLFAAEKDGETLVWTCYTAAHDRARLRFTCSHYRQQEPQRRKLIARAHSWLQWRAMRMFRDNAFTIYDVGGWYAGVEDQERLRINYYKEGFGGVRTRLYSMAIPLSLRGHAYLRTVGLYKRWEARLAVAGAASVERSDQRDAAGSRPGSSHAERAQRITFIINEMTPGGAERVIAIMANHWAKVGRRVTVMTIAPESPADYPLDSSVTRTSIELSVDVLWPISGLVNNLRRLSALRRSIARTRPDVVISFGLTVNILALLATRLLGIPVIVSERTVPAMSPRGPTWRILRRATYPLTDRLVVQTRDAGDYFWPSLQRRIRVIPNPIRALGGDASEDGAAREPVIVTVGRLEAVKQLDHVLRAFAGIADRFPEWRLAMLGDGSLRDSLKKLGDDLGVGSRVDWLGFVTHPEDFLRRAGLFVMASHHEGFPCAMQEAMACGLPVVSYDCPGGIREILRDGRDGVLVSPGDIGQLGKAMASLIEDPVRRARLGEAGLAVRERYSIDRIMRIWEDELQTVVRPRASAALATKYLIRFDDICPTMNWEVWREIEKILVEYGVKPILAVVPDNRDPKLRVDEPNPNFWDEVRKWQSRGWTIGLHGYQHAYVTTDAGFIGINRYSEFAGLPASEQREKIRLGMAIFRKEGVTPDLWIAPAHSFDTHTLEALRAEGVNVVSDGFFPAPGRDRRGMFWVPQQLWRFADRPRGVWTVCMHHNDWTQARLEQLRDEVKRRREQVTSVEEVLDVYGARKLSVTDRVFAKSYLALLLGRGRLRKLISFASSFRGARAADARR